MFSTKFSRVAHRGTCAAAHAQPSTAVHRAAPCLATRKPHQRRHSSSKASCPPDSSPSGGKPAPAAKAEETIADPASQQQRTKRVTRAKRPKNAVTTNKSGDQFAGLPAVPATSHLRDSDLAVSSFFSLHRPLSLSTTIPPATSPDAFENIFQARKEVDPWHNGNSAERRPEDVVYALGSLFENLDTKASDAQDENVRWEVIAESPSNHDGIQHLDGPPRQKSLDELIAEFKPFKAPPPPQPFPTDAQAQTQVQKEKKSVSKTRQKSYETKITFTEYTSPNGQTAFFASSSPIIQIENPEEAASIQEPAAEEAQTRFPFRQRMFEREHASLLRIRDKMQDQKSTQRLKMMLISVKRQRKLKMKKHKYKKLMKRTRNLRRRQDRA